MILLNCFRCCKHYGKQLQEARIQELAHSIDARAQVAAANSFSGAGDHQPNTSLRYRGSTGSDAAAGAGAAVKATTSVVSQKPDCPLSEPTIHLAHSKGVTLARIYNKEQVTVFQSERPNENAILYFVPSNPDLPVWQYFIIKDSVANGYSRLTNNLDEVIRDQLQTKFPSTAEQFVERMRQESKWPPESKQNAAKWPAQPNPNAHTSYSGPGPGPAAAAGQYKAIEAPAVATAVVGGQPPVAAAAVAKVGGRSLEKILDPKTLLAAEQAGYKIIKVKDKSESERYLKNGHGSKYLTIRESTTFPGYIIWGNGYNVGLKEEVMKICVSSAEANQRILEFCQKIKV